MSTEPDRRLLPGDPIPRFTGATTDNPLYKISTVAGRYIVLCLFGSAATKPAQGALAAMRKNLHLFDVRQAAFFGISTDAADRDDKRVADVIPGVRFFWDFDRAISAQFAADGAPHWLILDPTLRVIARFELGQADEAMAYVAALPPVDAHAGTMLSAPVLIVPRVFEPPFCRALIDIFRRHGGAPSGVTLERGGKTVVETVDEQKRRSDVLLDDDAVKTHARERIRGRLVPEIARAFQFTATRMERYLVARYDGQSGGYFRPHRDDTTKGTAHRRFAVTINLNAEAYEGGDLRFPEFGSRAYRAPTGGAVVFSCSLMHEALPVTKGERFAFLPFLYDDAAAKLREANSQFLDESIGPYVAGPPA